MGDDFRVGFGDERMALPLELLLQIEVVLDDAVVDDDDPAGAIAVRMRVLFGRPSVRRPSGVAEAIEAADRLTRDDLFEVGEFPRAATDVDAVAVDDGDTGGVVAAVFEPA